MIKPGPTGDRIIRIWNELLRPLWHAWGVRLRALLRPAAPAACMGDRAPVFGGTRCATRAYCARPSLARGESSQPMTDLTGEPGTFGALAATGDPRLIPEPRVNEQSFLRWAPLLAAVAASLCGCRTPAASEWFVAYDSAGARLAISARPAWTDQTSWHLTIVPDRVIGVADGPEEYQLDWISDAMRLPSGATAVGVAGSSEVRWYDGSGTYMRRAGRRGGGPGEFNTMADLRMWPLPGGMIAISNSPLPRANVFDTAGRFVRTIPLQAAPTGARPSLIGTFADGTLLTMTSEADAGRLPGQITRSTVRYFHYSANGSVLAEIARAETAPRYVHSRRGVTHSPYLPLTVPPVATADSLSVLVLRAGEPVLERFDTSGRLIGRITWRAARNPVTPELYRRYVAASLGTLTGDQRRLYEDYYRLELPLPEFAPSYRGILVDESRHIWLERFRNPGEADRTWDILDQEGRWLGSLNLPGRFWLHRAGNDYVLGTALDSLEVERLEVHRLSRDRPPGGRR